jgi:hypothetical protein
MARNYAALPYDYLEEMEALNDAEFGRLTRALLAYSMTGEQIALCGNERFYAKRVMAQEDRFKANYKEVSDARREAGKAGADARWQNGKGIFANGKNSKATDANGKNGYTETKTDTETNALPSNDGKRDMREARFIPPSISDVEQYCREKGYHINAEQFVCFYAQKGWMVGKNRMKDWKRAVQGWETRWKDEQKNAKSGFSYDYGNTEGSL